MKASVDSDGNIVLLDGKVKIPKREIVNLCYAQPNDVIVIGGTLIEGLGNIHSDLDIYVLCESRQKISDLKLNNHVSICNAEDEVQSLDSEDELYSTFDYYGDDGLHIDVKYITTSEIQGIIEKIGKEYSERSKEIGLYYTKFGTHLNFEEIKIFHRLHHCIPLGNIKRFSKIESQLPVDEFCYNSFHDEILDYFVFKDLQGAAISGNMFLACETARRLVFGAAQSLVYFFGCTNKNKKWIFSYLDQLPAKYILLGTRFKTVVFSSAETDDEKHDYILGCLDLIDAILEAIAESIDNRQGFPNTDQIMRALEHDDGSRSHNDHQIYNEAKLFRRKLVEVELPPLRTLVEFSEV